MPSVANDLVTALLHRQAILSELATAAALLAEVASETSDSGRAYRHVDLAPHLIVYEESEVACWLALSRSGATRLPPLARTARAATLVTVARDAGPRLYRTSTSKQVTAALAPYVERALLLLLLLLLLTN